MRFYTYDGEPLKHVAYDFSVCEVADGAVETIKLMKSGKTFDQAIEQVAPNYGEGDTWFCTYELRKAIERSVQRRLKAKKEAA